MKIFEGEAPVGAARRQLGLKLDLDLAEALFHLLDVWKLARNQLGRERMAVDSERQIAEHLGGVLAIWGGGCLRHSAQRERNQDRGALGCFHVQFVSVSGLAEGGRDLASPIDLGRPDAGLYMTPKAAGRA